MVAMSNAGGHLNAGVFSALDNFEEVSRAVDGRAQPDEAASSLSFASLLEDLRHESSSSLPLVEKPDVARHSVFIF
jgi:hypothetical protein